MGLLNFDSDDEEDIQELQTPKLKPGSAKKKSVSEKKLIVMSALITLCGKQRANRVLHGCINVRNAIFQTLSLLTLVALFISICFFLCKLFHHHVVLQNQNQNYHTMINDFMDKHGNVS